MTDKEFALIGQKIRESLANLYSAYWIASNSTDKLQKVLDAVQKHAEGGNIENYSVLSDTIEEIMEQDEAKK